MRSSFRSGGWLPVLFVLAWPLAAQSRQTAPTVPADATPATATTASTPYVPIPLASPDAAAVSTPSAPGAWGGERTGNEPTLSDRVVAYHIDAELDAVKHAVHGREQLQWRNRSDREIRSIYMHLYLNAFANEGSTFFTEREVLTAHGRSRGKASLKKGQWGWIDLNSVRQADTDLKWSFVHPDGGPATDHTVVRIDLAQPVPAGGTLALDIDFLSQLPRVVERTGWFGDFNLVAQWFPKIGVLELPGERGATEVRWNCHEFHFNSEFYADFGLYDVRLTVPADYTVGAVGELQGQPQTADGKTTYHYVQGDVHDFAWVAAKGYRTLDGSYEGPGSPKVAVRVIYPPEYEASAKPVLKASIDSLGYFSKTLGAYPYRTLTAVVPPYNAGEAGGMEYPTFFTAEGYKEVEPGTITQYMLDFVTIHEFGHGYFYGLLASNEFEEPMLDEGLNEYWDQRMLRERGQDLDLATPLMKRLGIVPRASGFALERLGAGLRQPPDPIGENAWDRLSSSSYGTVYSRTATAMHDLEERLGRPLMEQAFREYYKRWRYRHPSAADLRAALIDVSGKPDIVNQVFDQTVYGTAWVDDAVTSIDTERVEPLAGTFVKDGQHTENDASARDEAVDQQLADWKKQHPGTQDGTGPFPWRSTVTVRRYGAAAPQKLRLTYADGSHEDLPWNDHRRWARFVVTKPTKVVSAELDPQQTVYLDADKLNDSYATKANGAASRRWAADAAALLQNLYSLLGTL